MDGHLHSWRDKSQQSEDLEEHRQREDDVEAEAVTTTISRQRLEDVDHQMPFHPFDGISSADATQASLQAHSILNSLYLPSGSLVGRMPAQPDNDLVNHRAIRRPAERRISAPIMLPSRSNPLTALTEAPDMDVDTSEELPSDRDVDEHHAETELATSEVRPGKRPRISKSTPTSNQVGSHEAGADDADLDDHISRELPLRYYCGEPGCKGYRTAASLAGIRAHYKINHPNVRFDRDKLVATRSMQRSRAMSPAPTAVLTSSRPSS